MLICCLQIDDVGGRQYTYSQLVDHVHNCATSLSELGLRLGQRVCILLANCIELPVAFLAVQRLGAICVPINPTVTKCRPASQLTTSHLFVLVTDNPNKPDKS